VGERVPDFEIIAEEAAYRFLRAVPHYREEIPSLAHDIQVAVEKWFDEREAEAAESLPSDEVIGGPPIEGERT